MGMAYVYEKPWETYHGPCVLHGVREVRWNTWSSQASRVHFDLRRGTIRIKPEGYLKRVRLIPYSWKWKT
jgi:hypothetical protein